MLALCDLVVCATAIALAYLVRAHYGPGFLAPLKHSPTMYVRALPVVLGLWSVVFASLGMYEPRRTLFSIPARGADLRAVTIAVLMVAAASFLSHRDYSRLILLEFWGFAVILTWVSRSILGKYHRDVMASGRADSRAFIVGTGDLARIVLSRLREHPFGFEAVGFVAVGEGASARRAAASLGHLEALPIVGALADLSGLIVEHAVDEVLVADPAVHAGQLMEAIRESERRGVEFLIIAGPLQVLTAYTELSGPADLPVLELRRPSFGPEQRFVKRVVDVTLSLSLLLLTAPLLAGIALTIRRQPGAEA
ncbi:MAG: hypothetical protein WCP21_12460, partial [Armatimonadota bacterium]